MSLYGILIWLIHILYNYIADTMVNRWCGIHSMLACVIDFSIRVIINGYQMLLLCVMTILQAYRYKIFTAYCS